MNCEIFCKCITSGVKGATYIHTKLETCKKTTLNVTDLMYFLKCSILFQVVKLNMFLEMTVKF